MPQGQQAERGVVRVATSDEESPSPGTGRLLRSTDVPPGYGYYLTHPGEEGFLTHAPKGAGRIVLPPKFEYTAHGDVFGFWTDGNIRNLYRRSSKQNSFLVTDRCNSYCLMCSQPPKDVNDDWIIDEIRE